MFGDVGIMNDVKSKTPELLWRKVIESSEIQHMLPIRNNEGKRVFTLIAGLMLIPFLVGIPLILVSLKKPKRYKNIRVGICPICETKLGFEKTVTSFPCPECKHRSVIKKNRVHST